MRKGTLFLTFGLPASLFLAAIGCGSEESNPSWLLGSGGTIGSGGSSGSTGGSSAGGGDHSSGGSSGQLGSGGSASGGSGTGSGGDVISEGSGGAGTGGSNSAPATVTPGTCKADLGGYQNGSVTYYYFDQGTAKVNCSYDEISRNPDRVKHVPTNDGNYFGAMNTADYDTAGMCGACVEVTRDGSRRVTITIADQCPISTNPKCKPGHIDLSREAFDQLGNRGNEGYLGTSNGGDVGQISWKYVPCPGTSNVFFTLKEHDNLYWNQVLVSSQRYPIEKVEVLVEGTWVAAVRQEHNYWEPPDGKFGEETPYRVRVTDVNGSVLEAPVALMAGDQDSGVQFECN